jgi:hypothetical protein
MSIRLRYYLFVDLGTISACPISTGRRAGRRRVIMANSKKCANATCTCLAPEKKKYCSDHCEAIGNRMEIICLCGHADCGVTVLHADATSEAAKQPPATRS